MNALFSEALVYMPITYQINTYSVRDEPVSRGILPAGEQAPGTVVLANFNTRHKLEPVSFAAWMAVLRQCSRCVLWLLSVRLRQRSAESLTPQAQCVLLC